MTQFFTLLTIIFGTFVIAFTLINLRYWISGKEFRGTCANASQGLKDQIGECVVCGRKAGEACANPEKA
jgi:hypothetical protein